MTPEDLKRSIERWRKRMDERLMRDALTKPASPLYPEPPSFPMFTTEYRPPAPDLTMQRLIDYLEQERAWISNEDAYRAFRAQYENRPLPLTATEIVEQMLAAERIAEAYGLGYERARDRESTRAELRRNVSRAQRVADKAWLDSPDPVALLFEEGS